MYSNVLKKVLSWKPSLRFMGIVAVILLFLMLIPLIRLAFYAVPIADDFNSGYWGKKGIAGASIGVLGAIRGALEYVRAFWYGWQGTFACHFFQALIPIIWGEEYYFFGVIFLILVLPASVFVFFGILTKKVLCADKISALCLPAVAAIMVIELIHTSQEGFYWYNLGMQYVGMLSFGLLFVAVLIQIFCLKDCKSLKGGVLVVTAMLLALLVSGSNFVTTLQGLLICCSGMLLLFWVDRKKIFRGLPILAVYALGFYLNISAPGNAVRAEAVARNGWRGYSPWKAIFYSFVEAFTHLWPFTGWMTLAIMVLLIPIIWQIAGKSSFSFRLPFFFLVWSICLYASGFTPSLYALGIGGIDRTLNAVKVTYQVLLLLNEVYFIGWLRLFLEKKGKVLTWDNGWPWWFYGMIGICMILIWHFSPNQVRGYSSYGAYYYLHTGEAQAFYSEYWDRVKILRGSEADVVLEPYHYKPWMLCIGDWGEESNTGENMAAAAWFGKNSVMVRNGAD